MRSKQLAPLKTKDHQGPPRIGSLIWYLFDLIEGDLGVHPRRANVEVGEQLLVHQVAVGVGNARQTTVGQARHDHASGGH